MMGMTNPESVHYGVWDGSSIIICAYVLALLFICIKRKEYPHVFTLFVPASVLFLILLYFPPIYAHLPRTADNDQRQIFRRFRWMLMLLPVLSFVVVCVVSELKKKQKALFIVICLILLGVSVFYTSDGQEEYGFWDRTQAQDHLYKIPLFVKEMGDIIVEQNKDYLSKDKDRYVFMFVIDSDKSGRLGSPTYLSRLLRTYISPVRCCIINEQQTNGYVISEDSSVEAEYSYVLCSDRDDIVADCIKHGFCIDIRNEGCVFLSRRNK